MPLEIKPWLIFALLAATSLTLYNLFMRLGSGKIDGFLFTGLFNAVSAIVLISAYFIGTKMGWVQATTVSSYPPLNSYHYCAWPLRGVV